MQINYTFNRLTIKLLLFATLTCSTWAAVFDDFVYSTQNDEIVIVGYAGHGPVASIPDEIVGLPVTTIADSAFREVRNVTEVIIPDSVTVINGSAFESMWELTSVIIGSSVGRIDSRAFALNDSLDSVYFRGDAPDVVAPHVFYNPNESNITIYFLEDASGFSEPTWQGLPAEEKISFSQLSWQLIKDDTEVEITGLTRSVSYLEIPSSIEGKPVTSIGEQAFMDNEHLFHITIPDSVTHIQDYAFAYCDQLESLTLSSNLTHIGRSAFEDCRLYIDLVLPPSVETIGEQAFADSGIFSVSIPNSVETIGNYAFYSCGSLQSISMGTGLNHIPDGMFSFCINLRSAVIPEGVTTIGQSAFRSCFRMTSLTLPDSLNSISAYAFTYCIALTSFTIPENVATIGAGALDDCDGLTTLRIPQNVESIGPTAFSACSKLVEIQVAAANVHFTSVDGALFNTDRSLFKQLPGAYSGTYQIPNTVEVIEAGAFQDCRELTGIHIPDGVTTIGDYAFDLCRALTSIRIPQSVTNISEGPFLFCVSLESIEVASGNTAYSDVDGVLYTADQTKLIRCPDNHPGSVNIPDTVTEISSQAFYSCDNVSELVLPDGLTEIGYAAFQFSNGLSSLIIPATVQTIGTAAFQYAYNLNTVYFEGNAPASFGGAVFNQNGFSLYFNNSATGFTTPSWKGYRSIEINTNDYPHAPWLLSHGQAYDASLTDDVNGDGITLLVAYALNLPPDGAPSKLPAGSYLKGASPSEDTLRLKFFSGRPDITYQVKTSTNLVNWTTEGVTLSAVDSEGNRTASTSANGQQRFMRIELDQK